MSKYNVGEKIQAIHPHHEERKIELTVTAVFDDYSLVETAEGERFAQMHESWQGLKEEA
jgi:hypothetical protein